jgi:Pregnancy-associated plasma protein-A
VGYPRVTNVFVLADATSGGPQAYGYYYKQNSRPRRAMIFIRWDYLDGYANYEYDDTGSVLAHELGHQRGVDHPFGYTSSNTGTCDASHDDFIADTSPVLGAVFQQSWSTAACTDCLNGYKALPGNWSTTKLFPLAVPAGGAPSYADSCPAGACARSIELKY